MEFRATVQLNGKTATGIEIPDEIVAALGSGKRPAVLVTINGYSYRSTVAPMGGVSMIPVSADVRERAGIAAGDDVTVEIALDTAPRVVVVPDDLAEALASDPAATQFFESLSYSNKRRIVLPIEEAKTAETRQRRIANSISNLHEGRI